ncbi:NADP-dependent oxidoreductase [Streptomyces sp. NPDC026672]|uniref:NADP-dependent oxidoreductase n=1 Tax=unclassified Streptomyces TaxID=2593676 RepID=UPI0033E51656
MIQQRMRAVVVRRAGGPDSVEVIEVERPEPGLAQVRVRVHAATLNPVDAGVWSGVFGRPADGGHLALGWEFSGVVDAVGPMANHAPGDAVIGYVQGPVLTHGAQAEYVVAPANAVAPAPDGIDLTAAATIPLPGLTASQGLDLLALSAGSTVLVAGAAGAVGGYAVQLAKAQGMRVIGLDLPGTEETVVDQLGADRFVASGEHPADAVLEICPGRVDGVLDAASLGSRVIEAVKDGGSYVTTDPRPEFLPAPGRGVRRRVVLAAGDGARLSTLADHAAAGRLTLRVAETYPLTEARRAHERLAAGGLRGKIVLLP